MKTLNLLRLVAFVRLRSVRTNGRWFTSNSPTNLVIRVLLCAAIVYVSNAEAGAQLIPEGTKVRVRLEQPLSSATAEEGQSVQLAVSDDVVIDGAVVIARDSVVNGTIVLSQSKRRMGRTGKLDFSVDHVLLSDGERLPVRYTLVKKEGGSKAVSTGIITAGVAILFFPAAPFVLLRKGKETVFNKGQRFEVFTDVTYTVKPGSTRLAPIATSDQPTMSNEDVVALKEAGFSDVLILAKIDAAPGAYKLDTQSLIQLKEVGVSEEVIAALTTRGTAPPPTPTSIPTPTTEPPILNCSLLPTDTHGSQAKEFLIQATARDSVDGILTPLVELFAFDQSGDGTFIASLNDSEKIFLITGKKKITAELPKKGQLVEKEFHVRAEAAHFQLSCRVTNSRAVSVSEEVQIE